MSCSEGWFEGSVYIRGLLNVRAAGWLLFHRRASFAPPRFAAPRQL